MNDDIAARMASQNAEFDAARELAKQWRRIELTPVVEDDYPSVRADYDRAVRTFLEATSANGRCARSESAAIMPSNEAVILAAKIVVKKGEFADLFTASTAAILLATEMLKLAYPNGVPEGLK